MTIAPRDVETSPSGRVSLSSGVARREAPRDVEPLVWGRTPDSHKADTHDIPQQLKPEALHGALSVFVWETGTVVPCNVFITI